MRARLRAPHQGGEFPISSRTPTPRGKIDGRFLRAGRSRSQGTHDAIRMQLWHEHVVVRVAGQTAATAKHGAKRQRHQARSQPSD